MEIHYQTGRQKSKCCSDIKMTKHIKLTQGKVALVDDVDFEWLDQYKWFCDKTHSGYRAMRHNPTKNGKRKMVYMHREIMDASSGIQVDHINHSTLDNRRSNLRLCTNTENTRNGRKRTNNTSGFKGVIWKKDHKKWAAQATLNGKHHHLGYFDDVIKAAHAYDTFAHKHFGEFALLNFT